MRNQKGYVAGYNGQAVSPQTRSSSGAMLSQHPAGRTLLHPLLDTCREQLTEAGIRPELRTVLAGSGYASEENFAVPMPVACGSSRRWPGPGQGPGPARAPRRTRHLESIRPPPAPPGACDIPAERGTAS